MPSLLEALSGGLSFSSPAVKDSGSFALQLGLYKDSVVNDYNKYSTPLNESIAKIAKENSLNDNQIQRIVEEVNNQVYLVKYAQVKQYKEREVIFDLASLKVVKGILEGKEAIEDNDSIEKKASWKEGDDLNFLNYNKCKLPGMREDKIKPLSEIMGEKLAHEISEKNKNFDKALEKFAETTYDIAEALIKYDRFNKDPQEIFSHICKEASVNKYDQIMIKKAVTQKVNQLKEARYLPSDYKLELNIVDCAKEDNFSLGEYSLNKRANVAQSNVELPVIETDSKKVIKNIQSLINMAEKMQEEKQKVINLNENKNIINNLK